MTRREILEEVILLAQKAEENGEPGISLGLMQIFRGSRQPAHVRERLLKTGTDILACVESTRTRGGAL